MLGYLTSWYNFVGSRAKIEIIINSVVEDTVANIEQLGGSATYLAERLANASERVANKLGWILEHEQDDDPDSVYVRNCRALVDLMLEFLDGLEADPDLEETAFRASAHEDQRIANVAGTVRDRQ